MAVYAWRGRNARGEAVQGQLEAVTENGVADQLIAMGVSPVQISAVAEDTKTNQDNWFERLNRKPVVVEDVLVFSRQMYTLNKAGVPILRAFAGLEASSTKPAMWTCSKTFAPVLIRAVNCLLLWLGIWMYLGRFTSP